MLRRDAANERLQKINAAARLSEASEMECHLLAQTRSAAMSAILLLSEDKQTRAQIAENITLCAAVMQGPSRAGLFRPSVA